MIDAVVCSLLHLVSAVDSMLYFAALVPVNSHHGPQYYTRSATTITRSTICGSMLSVITVIAVVVGPDLRQQVPVKRSKHCSPIVHMHGVYVQDIRKSQSMITFLWLYLQILGGNGYINEYPTGRLLRDAKLYEIGAGTSEIRRYLIGRELAKECVEGKLAW